MLSELLGAAADGWTGEQLAPILAKAAECEWGAAIVVLMQQPGVVWSSNDLQPAVEHIARACEEELYPGWRYGTAGWKGRVPRRTYEELVDVLLGAAGDQWTEQQLAPSVLLATKRSCSKVVNILLGRLVGGWSSQQLWPALQLATNADKFSCVHERIPIDLIQAAQGQWTGDQLVTILHIAGERRWFLAVKILAEQEGFDKTAENLQAAMAATAAADELYSTAAMLSWFLAISDVAWQAEHLEAGLAAAARHCRWRNFTVLLKAPAAAGLSSQQLQGLLAVLMQQRAQGIQSSRHPSSSSFSHPRDREGRCAAALDVLAHPNGDYASEHLADALIVAAAAGHMELLLLLLKQRGLQWDKGQLQAAIKGAIMGEHWEAMQQLLSVPFRGWLSSELRPVLQAIAGCKHAHGVQQLLGLAGGVLAAGWHPDHKFAALVAALGALKVGQDRKGPWQCIQHLLGASLEAGWGTRELQQVLLAAAAKDSVRCSTLVTAVVQEVLGYPGAVWRGEHMVEAAAAAAGGACSGGPVWRGEHLVEAGAAAAGGASSGGPEWRDMLLGLMLAVEGAGWTGGQLGKVLGQAARIALKRDWYVHAHDQRERRDALKVVVSQVLAVAGSGWKEIQFAQAVEEACGKEAWDAVQVLLCQAASAASG